jgi:acetyl-CoA carboxylase alpha subunit
MKIQDLDGNIHKWKIEGSIVRSNDQRPRSQLHLTARSLIKEIYPTLQICEEVSAQIKRDRKVFLDFYINTIKTVVEVHGQQHYKFNSLYHTSAQDFLNQKKRDQDLQDWCVLNNLNYIELPFNEDKNKWHQRFIKT